MKTQEMTSMERVMTALSHKEPDRVPLFLLLTLHGAKELGLSIRDYFSKAENVVEGQLRLRKKYRNDCFYPLFYAALEIEAFGGEVIFCEDGPPNSGTPFIAEIGDINHLVAPQVKDCKILHRVLHAIEKLKEKSHNSVPIIGVVLSPFSLPVMQLGFDKYFEVMHFHPGLFDKLMKVNQAFCIEWANAQLKAGATAIGYFDPVSSTTIIPREFYYKTGYPIACQTLSQINGPTATHFASGICLPIIDYILQTGTAAIGISASESISALKQACKNRMTLIGNLNGIEMRRWSAVQAGNKVAAVIQEAADGGGFILSDNHGEIPWQVADETLHSIADAVLHFGSYPIRKP
jgi:uroporphyrinogen decarboxylase